MRINESIEADKQAINPKGTVNLQEDSFVILGDIVGWEIYCYYCKDIIAMEIILYFNKTTFLIKKKDEGIKNQY